MLSIRSYERYANNDPGMRGSQFQFSRTHPQRSP
jgi:hypothetical protein